MRFRLVAGLAALSLSVAATPLMAQEARPFTYQDLVELNRVSDPKVSPDGDSVSYSVRATDLENNRGVTTLWLADLTGDAEPRRLGVSDEGASTGRWGPDGSLYFLSNRSGSTQVWKTDVEGATATQVTDLPLDVQTFRIAPSGDRLAVSLSVYPDCEALTCTVERMAAAEDEPSTGQVYDKLFVRHWDTWMDGTQNHVFTLPLGAEGATGEPVWVSQGFDGDVPSKPFGGEEDYAFSPDGDWVVFSGRTAGTTEPWSTNFDLWRAPAEGGDLTNLTDANEAWDAGPVFSPDGRTLAYRAMARPGFEADRWQITLMDVDSGQTRQIAANWDRSPDSLSWSPDGRTLYATAQDVGKTKLFAIDVTSGQVTPITGEGHVFGVETTPSGFVFGMDSMGAPADLYVKTYRGREMPRRITDHNADTLTNLAMGEYEQFSFPGWNGETVHGYVVKPANFVEGEEYPVAFLIHGGPQGSFGDAWSYRWNPQTYAGAGYAVVMIDFHGSTGYGQDFTDSITQHWGDRPLEDLQKGWEYAQQQYDFLDGDNACALGASYGGYMVSWIAGKWPNEFKCLVNHDGVFDTRFMAFSTEELWFTEWENGGTPWERGTTYERFNPINEVANWRAPMMVVSGGRDYRVPTDQSIAAFTAAQRQGIESKFLYFPDENHWVLKPANSLHWHEEVEEWLARWLRPEASAAN
ncbi:prolyl oligopeptidase family serine peptidase [Brevundimonas sp.]|uniref:S9 family peptidase n=1 Tax=Brevundimonas sp. TaxID=1871086 RepID=UPI0035B0692F